jgi:hypothetical protein
MLLPLRLLLLLLLKQSTHHISNHTQQSSPSSSSRRLTLRLPPPIQINCPVESRMIPRPLLPLKMINIILLWIRRIPRIVVV